MISRIINSGLLIALAFPVILLNPNIGLAQSAGSFGDEFDQACVEEMLAEIGEASIELCLMSSACETELATSITSFCQQGAPVPQPGEVPSPQDQIKELLKKIFKKLKSLPICCDPFKTTQKEVWEKVIQKWLRELGFDKYIPSATDIFDKKLKVLQKFLDDLKEFLKTRSIKDIRKLLRLLKELFKNDPALKKLIEDLEKLLPSDENAPIPDWMLEEFLKHLRELII